MTSLEGQIYGHEIHGPVLGELVFYKVHQARLPHAQGKQLYEELGMGDVALPLPPIPKDLDTFARICSENAKKEIPSDTEGVGWTLLVRPVNQNLRIIVFEARNAKGETLEHAQIGELRFVDGKATGETYTTPYTGPAKELIDHLRSQFRHWQGCHHSYQIREWIRGSLLQHEATAIRDGLYFVPAASAKALAKIEDFTSKIPGKVKIHTLPLIDTDNQRAMVEEAFTDEAMGTLETLLSEVGDLVNLGNEITQARYDGLHRRYRGVAGKIDTYSTILDKHLNSSGLRMEMLEDALMNLGGQVK
jgi:hypothetical protein